MRPHGWAPVIHVQVTAAEGFLTLGPATVTVTVTKPGSKSRGVLRE